MRETVQQNFLKYISQTIIRDLEKNHPKVLERFLVNTKDSKYKIWQRRPLSIDLWTKEVFIQKMEYIHDNPVKAGLCKNEEDYKYSSARFYKTGIDDFWVSYTLDGVICERMEIKLSEPGRLN